MQFLQLVLLFQTPWENYLLCKNIYNLIDVFLYGHEHFDAVENLCQKDNFLVKSIAQGMDFSQKNISYTTILVDFDSNQISTKMFEWNKDNEMFIGRKQRNGRPVYVSHYVPPKK